MGLFSKKNSGKYFSNDVEPSCSYCENGKRSNDGMKIMCSKKGPVELTFSCNAFKYSPLKRVPVKQLHIVGNFDMTGTSSGLPEDDEPLKN
ncbi:MAG: hypothetical protein LBM93_14785 [Oscillospiraceae bacterium]|jgi:hypothetical protein|nr:hypothetical protein [Oscillospiraceae bacterium]